MYVVRFPFSVELAHCKELWQIHLDMLLCSLALHTASETVSSQQILKSSGFLPFPSVRWSAGSNAHVAHTKCCFLFYCSFLFTHFVWMRNVMVPVGEGLVPLALGLLFLGWLSVQYLADHINLVSQPLKTTHWCNWFVKKERHLFMIWSSWVSF